MDALSTFLESLKEGALVRGHFLGLLNILIGRRISTKDGTVISRGLSWRELASLLKRLRWDPENVRELGLDPESLPPRDRQRYWYAAITRAGVDSTAASSAGDHVAELLAKQGYDIGPGPSR
jgi:hypothetical protein